MSYQVDITTNRNQDGDDRALENANARLIASAPELLAALQCISGWSICQCSAKHGDNQNCPVLIAERAIAKATGEPQSEKSTNRHDAFIRDAVANTEELNKPNDDV